MSKEIVNGGPAFPSRAGNPGMTLRDYFAGQAISALVTEQTILYQHAPETNAEYRTLATHAYALADAMLEARTVGGRRDEDEHARFRRPYLEGGHG